MADMVIDTLFWGALIWIGAGAAVLVLWMLFIRGTEDRPTPTTSKD